MAARASRLDAGGGVSSADLRGAPYAKPLPPPPRRVRVAPPAGAPLDAELMSAVGKAIAKHSPVMQEVDQIIEQHLENLRQSAPAQRPPTKEEIVQKQRKYREEMRPMMMEKKEPGWVSIPARALRRIMETADDFIKFYVTMEDAVNLVNYPGQQQEIFQAWEKHQTDPVLGIQHKFPAGVAERTRKFWAPLLLFVRARWHVHPKPQATYATEVFNITPAFEMQIIRNLITLNQMYSRGEGRPPATEEEMETTYIELASYIAKEALLTKDAFAALARSVWLNYNVNEHEVFQKLQAHWRRSYRVMNYDVDKMLDQLSPPDGSKFFEREVLGEVLAHNFGLPVRGPVAAAAAAAARP